MSLCQPNTGSVSCGGCCGIGNLNLSAEDRQALLDARTREFRSGVDFAMGHTMAAYRQTREKLEAEIPKHDPTTYSCPFLGWVGEKRLGCMIHPVFTGNPKSQNYSFYGASICQTYDCKNKENARVLLWQELFLSVAQNSLEYTELCANHKLISLLERWMRLQSTNLSLAIPEGKEVWCIILRWSLEKQNTSTSFEILTHEPVGREELLGALVLELGKRTVEELEGILRRTERPPKDGTD